jgi:hypothetical protein
LFGEDEDDDAGEVEGGETEEHGDDEGGVGCEDAS